MNEPTLPAAAFEPNAPVYRDRSTGLLVFGILTILLGALCGLLVLLMFVGQAFGAKATHTPSNNGALLSGGLVYGVLAVALIWIGIGSIMARRWARALLLIFSWSWLVMGIIVMVCLMIIMPGIMSNLPAGNAGHTAPPPGMLGVMMGFMLLFCGFFMVLLPGIWIYFYRSPHVKATCETRDPVPGWTDVCPLPLLALSLWLMFGVPFLLLMPVTHNSTMPFFGMFVSGLPGTLFCWLMAVVWCYAAWAIYHLRPQGWWLVMIAMSLLMVSNVLTFSQHDIWEMYRLMDYPQAQIDQIQKLGMFGGNRVMWFSAICILPFLGYLLFVKKYFRARA